MARNTQLYSQSKNSVVVYSEAGGWNRTMKDFFEGDDVIAWEPNAERVAVTEGLDGAALSVSSGRAGKITIKLKPTSPCAGLLNKLANLNSSDPQLVDVSIVTGVEEVVKLVNCLVHAEGSSSGGATMQASTFVFTGTKLTLDEDEGAAT